MAASQRHIELAKSLPSKLLSFFARHPPAAFRAPNTATASEGEASTVARIQPNYENPFQVTKNEATGKWRPPTYSMRRQAELSKLAHAHGVAELLPYTPKSLEERTRRRWEHGLRVRGTGVGQKVKGHFWERALKWRLEARRDAMRKMPAMVAEWKRLGHGRRWKDFPKK